MEHCINLHESMHNNTPYIYTCKLIRIWLMMCQLNVQSYCFCHVLMIFTGKKHTFQLNTIEVYERERILNIIWFYHEKLSQEWKQISNGDCLHFFSIWKAVEHLAKFFQHYHQDAFMLIAMQNPFRLLIFSCVLISDKIERILKKKFLWYHSSYTCTCIRKTFSFHTEEKMIKSFKLD